MTSQSTMRLGDAIMLGRHLVQPQACCIRSCVLGMALAAVGCTDPDYRILVEKWPWVNFYADLSHPLCTCASWWTCDRYFDVITHLFDSHVAEGKMTLETLVDWISIYDPGVAPTPVSFVFGPIDIDEFHQTPLSDLTPLVDHVSLDQAKAQSLMQRMLGFMHDKLEN